MTPKAELFELRVQLMLVCGRVKACDLVVRGIRLTFIKVVGSILGGEMCH